jgi:hypothetical protein
VSIEESVADIVQRGRAHGRTDFDNLRHYTIRLAPLLKEARKTSGTPASVLDAPTDPHPQ